jgi:hypothetical protein
MSPSSEHRTHRLAHAIYGLIVLTAAVGELRALEEDLHTAAVVLAGTFVVLIIAHGYSQMVANTATHARVPNREFMLATTLDQLAIGLPAALAIAVLALSETSLMSLSTAYNIVVAGSITVLAAVGILIGRHHALSWSRSIGFGVANLAVGTVVVSIEAFASH